jgi:hypothetical protein
MSNTDLYNIDVYDGLVNKTLQKEVYNYLQQQTWHVYWYPRPALPGSVSRFKPKNGVKDWVRHWPNLWPSASFHRCCLGRDEEHLKEDHPLILKLWDAINSKLDNQYELTGYPEDMFDEQYSKENGEDGWGWRIYVNGMLGMINVGTWGPHRDTPDLNDETSVTILYFVSPEWYPRWGGEINFFPEDPTGSTGDRQQFNKGAHQQQREYNVGWLDGGRVVSPVPGRVVVYDGRCLHNANPPSSLTTDPPLWRVAFRARKKI